MSSAEDIKTLSISPPANSSTAEPAQPSNQPSEGQARSKPNIETNMVAQEVRVNVTGVRPAGRTGKRELFTEEATSVLVHENGGVIPLSVAVIQGQLLLLSNIESKSKVVAQVRRNRICRPTGWYVELEFAEPAPRFWGRDFSASSSLLPKDPKDAQAAALVMSAEASPEESSVPPAAPTFEEVQALKEEVQALQEQPIDVTRSPKSQPTVLDRAFLQLTAAEEAQLPQPSLDFSAPKRWRLRRARGKFTPGFRGGVLRLALLTTALLLTAGGAAWYKNWIPWKPAKKVSPNAPAVADNPVTSAPLGSRRTAEEHSKSSNSRLPAETLAVASPTPAAVAVSPDQPSASSDRLPPAVRATFPSPTPPPPTSTGKRALRPTAAAISAPVVASSVQTGLVPPKLLRSVRAVASLDDLRDFETGNVVIDAVVGTGGEVHFVSVLSGPPSLRAAAVEAIKQYQYQPATLNGQPVPAHVTISVRFRFES
jgi:TonB family protein